MSTDQHKNTISISCGNRSPLEQSYDTTARLKYPNITEAQEQERETNVGWFLTPENALQ